MARRGNLRFTSTRAYRRYIEELLHQGRRGEVPASTVKNLAAAARIACELMMAENIMDATGLKDAEVKLEGDQDGGFKFQAHRKAKTFTTQKRTTKVVVDKHGETEETDTLSREGGDDVTEPLKEDQDGA